MSCIDSHDGRPIGKDGVESAAKRVYGCLEAFTEEERRRLRERI